MFKGGTCLSKCHRAIDRFSEDVDLGMEEAHVTEGIRKALKRAVTESAAALKLDVTNIGQTRSRRHSRHIYDLRKLQGLVAFDESLAALFAAVRKQRLGKPRCLSADPEVNLAAVLRELADDDVYKRDYLDVTVDLLYDNMPYEEAVKALRDVAEFVDDIDWDS